MALIPIGTVETYCGASSGDANIAIMHPAIEKHIQTIIYRNLESQTYTHERYDGDGSNLLFLNHYPVTALMSVCSSTATALTIENTSDDTSAALVNIESDKLQLYVASGVNTHGWEDFLFASYTDLEALKDQIAAYGMGWTCTIESTDYNDYPSTDLLPVLGANALSALSLLMPSSPVAHHVQRNQGIVYASSGIWPAGVENIIITYTAGYTTTPDDIKLLILTVIKEIYDRKSNSSEGFKKYSLADINRDLMNIFERDFIKNILSSYKKILL